jgi:alpha-L-arabinofuranosidase
LLASQKNFITSPLSARKGRGVIRLWMDSAHAHQTVKTMFFKLPRILAVFLLTVLQLAVLSVQAKADEPVYTDALVGGWQPWSWCTVDLASTAYVHSGSKSIQATYTGGWQGLYLGHRAFDTTPYTSLTFWIHGGGVNGRVIQVQALLNYAQQTLVNLNTYIAGGAVSGSQWCKVDIPLSALGVAGKTNMTGFWLQDASGGAQPAFYVDDVALSLAPPPSLIHLNVDVNNRIRTVDSRVFGLNTAIADAQLNTPDTITLVKAAAVRVLRFPGGSLADRYHWQTNTSEGNTWPSGFDAFIPVLKGCAAQAFITVNYGTGTPQEAADWVAYANKTKTLGIKYWEIGNENYGASWEADNQTAPHDPYIYAVRAKDYVARMKAADPLIKVGVVAVTGEDSFANSTNHAAVNPRTGETHYGWTPVMLSTLKSLGVTPDFLVYHRYEQGPGEESDAMLLQYSRTWKDDASDLRRQITDYLQAPEAAVELVSTENNSVYANPGKQTTSLVNGLFLADSIGNLLQTEFNAMVWWDLRDWQESGNNNDVALYGWRQYGDYGIMSAANDTYPTYHVLKLLSKLAKDGDIVVKATSDYPLVAAYASHRADGTLAVMVINKSPNRTLKGRIALTGFTPKARATQVSYGIPQDEAARTGVGSRDLKTTSFSGASASFTRAFSPYSATVVVLSPSVPNATIVPVEDAYVRAGTAASTNYGAATTFSVRRSSNNSANSNNRCAYLKLDLTSVATAPQLAMLNLTASGASPRTSSSPVKIYYVADTSWTETGITWNNAPGLNRAKFSSTGLLVASRTIPLGAPTGSFDLTAFVAANLGKVATLQIMSDAVDNNTVGFKSRDASSGKPTLSLAY